MDAPPKMLRTTLLLLSARQMIETPVRRGKMTERDEVVNERRCETKEMEERRTLGYDFVAEQDGEHAPEYTRALGGHLLVVMECLEQVRSRDLARRQRGSHKCVRGFSLVKGQKHFVGLTRMSCSKPAKP